MKDLINNLKNQPLSIKIPLILVFTLICYSLVNFGSGILNQKKIDDELKNLKFKVSKVYFESRFTLRNYADKFMILEIANPITEEQFKNMNFIVSNEQVTPELVTPNKIKINFNSQFRKGVTSSLVVSFYGKRIYSFDFSHSNMDAEDAKRNPIVEPDKY